MHHARHKRRHDAVTCVIHVPPLILSPFIHLYISYPILPAVLEANLRYLTNYSLNRLPSALLSYLPSLT